MAMNVMNQSRKLLDKLLKIKSDTPENPYLFSDVDIGTVLINARLMGCANDTNDTSVAVTMYNEDNKDYIRFLYQIKVQVNGRVKNADCIMALINDFEHEFIYADKINVIQDAGIVYIDILKQFK